MIMFDKDDNLNILTEVGVFGELDIDDPTAKKVKRKKDNMENIDKLIEEAIENNGNISFN